MALAVLLSGRHETLPAAELEALLAAHGAADGQAPLAPRIVTVPDRPETRAATARMALARQWGPLVADAEASPDGLQAAAETVQAASDGQGSVAVRAVRVGARGRLAGAEVERTIGHALVQAGHPVDLDTPDTTWYAWYTDEALVVGRLAGATDATAYQARHGERRAHFSPVTLEPRIAAALVHLARVPPGGTVYDPFCGTGGILLEAAIDGYQVIGSDVDAWMVQGTLGTLTDAGPEPLTGTAFVADIGAAPDLVGQVDGVVTDLPYGRAATTGREDLARLYDRALEAFSRLLPPGGHAVVGCAAPDLLPRPEAHGFQGVAAFDQYVHRSMTRRFAVIKKHKGVP